MYSINFGCYCYKFILDYFWDSSNPYFLGLFRDLLYVFNVMY